MRKKHDNIRLYHVDHLGSTTLVTDIDGEITQHVAYIPYGEIFVEQRNGSWNTPYLFNAKELDEETGLYYYGARYLDPTHAAWLSVDPMFEKYVGASPYNYCHGNPIVYVDPDGLDEYGLDETTGRLSRIAKTQDDKTQDDKIYVGSYLKDGSFKKGTASFTVSKGILSVEDNNTDLSKTGISVPVGKQTEGVDLMVKISYNIYRELSAWGYYTKNEEKKIEGHGLEIAPWCNNTYNRAKMDKYSDDHGMDTKGIRTFQVHTHPGSKDGKSGGDCKPSSGDYRAHVHLKNCAKFYIISRKFGLTTYIPTNDPQKGKYYGTTESAAPKSLKKYVNSKYMSK